MKVVVSLFALSVVACAQASYELGLFLRPTEVIRYDTENFVRLGSFGAGRISGARAITVNPVLGEAYVLHSNGKGVAVFDYSTGGFKRSLGFGTAAGYTHISIAPNGNLLLSGAYASGSEFAEYTAGGLLSSFRTLTAGTVALDFIRMPNNFFYGLSRRPSGANWEFQLQSFNGNTLFQTTSLITSPSIDNTKNLISSGNRFNITTNSNAPSRFYTANSDGTTTLGGNFSYPFSSTPSIANAFGHGDLIYALRSTAFATPNTYEMAIWDPGTLTYLSGNTISGMPEDFVDFTTIVAPEPGSLLALIAGAWFVARRKRA